MQTTTGAILLVIGVVALFAAIVGGGVKIREIEVGSLPSRWRQGLLGIFGIVVAVTGLIMVMNPGEGGRADAAAQNNESLDQANDENAPETDTDTADQNTGDTTAADANGAEAGSDSNSGEESTQQQ